ncbi:MAG: hypothetical protein HZB61_12365 [Nitrospirae bacterium]|nr:hypothetical protein [Nitrospirota bacterium]
MKILTTIGFDNSARLCRNTYYFEYKGVRFKLIQRNMRKWCDALFTIIQNDDNSKNLAFNAASEFLTALSWQNDSRIKLRPPGGISVPDNFQLRKAKSGFFSFPEIPYHIVSRGYDICIIPEIETEEQKTALILFREALSSNNVYLSFLFYWQILETGGNEPIGWINSVIRKKKNYNRLLVSKAEINHLPLNGKSLGNYLYDDCRNAIAHIRRDSGKVKLKFDSLDDIKRLAISTNVVKKFARFYIENNIRLQNNLYLVRQKGTDFPVFVNEGIYKNSGHRLAYKRLSLDKVHKKR